MTHSSSSAGRLIAGRYRLLSSIGTGGMGIVWAGRDEVLERDVAVKELIPPPGLPSGEEALLTERSLREARAAARLRSDAAVTVYDVVEVDGRPCIVMELLQPRTLADVLRHEGPQPPRRVAEIGLRLLDALNAGAAAGVLHRDVKPGNVLFRADGRAVLTDFGIASLDGDSSITLTGTLLGSPAYVAPERVRGKPATAAADLWSLGVTLYAAVEGVTPFERDEGPMATLAAVLESDVPPAPNAGPLRPVLEGLLQREPERRVAGAEARKLLQLAARGQTPPVRPVAEEPDEGERRSISAIPAGWPLPKRLLIPIGAGAAALLLVPAVPGGVGGDTSPDAQAAAPRTPSASPSADSSHSPGTAEATVPPASEQGALFDVDGQIVLGQGTTRAGSVGLLVPGSVFPPVTAASPEGSSELVSDAPGDARPEQLPPPAQPVPPPHVGDETTGGSPGGNPGTDGGDSFGGTDTGGTGDGDSNGSDTGGTGTGGTGTGADVGDGGGDDGASGGDKSDGGGSASDGSGDTDSSPPSGPQKDKAGAPEKDKGGNGKGSKGKAGKAGKDSKDKGKGSKGKAKGKRNKPDKGKKGNGSQKDAGKGKTGA